MVAHFYLVFDRNNMVVVGECDRNDVAVVRNHHVVADRFDMAVEKVL